MLKKVFGVLLFILLISYVIFRAFVYYDPEYGCFIKVIPSWQPSNWKVSEVLQIIKTNAPNKYSYLCTKVGAINKNVGCGGLDGGCFYMDRQNTIYVGNDSDNIALTAGIVVHELCHVKQYDESRELSETECYAETSRFLSNITIK